MINNKCSTRKGSPRPFGEFTQKFEFYYKRPSEEELSSDDYRLLMNYIELCQQESNRDYQEIWNYLREDIGKYFHEKKTRKSAFSMLKGFVKTVREKREGKRKPEEAK